MLSERRSDKIAAKRKMGNMVLRRYQMLKYAFVINVAGESPETYSTVYENEESRSIVAGVDGMEAGKRYVATLVEEGFTCINLCGDFNDRITAQMRQAAGDQVRIRHAEYAIEELAKLDRLETLRDYGVIILMRGVDKPYEAVLRCDKCDTRIIFVRDMTQAKRAAEKLVAKRVNFIELSSWFDRLRMDSIVKAIRGAVPVGTCGDLYMRDLED